MHIFITGTDTDIGKTIVTAGLAAVMQSLGYKAGVYKPFQSGAVEKNGFLVSPDLAYVKKMDFYVETLCTYLLKEPTAPYIAAELEGININLGTVAREFQTLRQACETVLVEGAGGLMVPVTKEAVIADVIKMLDIPLLIVARPNLGTINHTILTINQAKTMGLDIAGVIINRYPEGTQDAAIKTAPRLIEEYTDVNILGIIPDIPDFDTVKPGFLINIFINCIDIEKIFRIKIPKLNLTL
ncbi:MAG: dethiobiotin synthase [Clostridium sp.]|nr:dethiobiotin synthase [Clostridium sp.]